jgi:chromosome segregation ATPase
MGDVTFGVKVPEDLKEQLAKLMQDSGLAGKDFMQSLVNVYQVEKTKEGIPEVAQDLKELQGLTQRINNIYLNLGYRIDNLMKSKEAELQEQLQRKNAIIVTLQNKIDELDSKSEMLTEAFNTSVNDKCELETRVNELTESNNSIKALNEEYKAKFDTMAGIVEEYKHYKVEVEEYKKLLADSQTRNIELESSIKEKDFE